MLKEEEEVVWEGEFSIRLHPSVFLFFLFRLLLFFFFAAAADSFALSRQ